jgi:hypothetical protein
VNCASCGASNQADAVFCEECGASFGRECPSCGTSCSPSAKYCRKCRTSLGGDPVAKTSERDPRSYTPKHLVEKILSSRSALEGERKHVTVLFCDVKGSMDLAATPKSGTGSWIASSRSSPKASTASRARSTSTRATASWRCSAPRSHTKTMRSGLQGEKRTPSRGRETRRASVAIAEARVAPVVCAMVLPTFRI